MESVPGDNDALHTTWAQFQMWGDHLVKQSCEMEGNAWTWCQVEKQVASTFYGHGGKYLMKKERGMQHRLSKESTEGLDGDVEASSRWHRTAPNRDIPLPSPSTSDREECDKIQELNESDEDVDIILEAVHSSSTHNVVPMWKESAAALIFEYHIVYSQTYCNPVMLVNASHPGGQTLTMEELYQYIPSHVYNNPMDVDDSADDRATDSGLTPQWSFLTQVPHPVLGLPFFEVHPCQTATVLASMIVQGRKHGSSSIGADNNMHRSLYCWLSVYAQAVGLRIPLPFWSRVLPTLPPSPEPG